jgi:hypothetical protein
MSDIRPEPRPAGKIVCHSHPFVIFSGVVVLAGVYARFHGLHFQSLWTDEGMSSVFAAGAFADTLNVLQRDYHPPLYFLLLNLWSDLFGTSEVALRSLSAVFSGLQIPALFLLGNRLGGRSVGVITALLAATSLYQIYYAQEARAYALLGAFAAFGLHAYLVLLERRTWLRVAYWVLLHALVIYTHYIGFFLLLAESLHFFLHQVAFSSRSHRMPIGRLLAFWGLLQGLVLLLFLPWLPSFLQQLDVVRDNFWLTEPTWADLAEIFAVLLVYRPAWWNGGWFLGVLALGAGLVLLLGWRSRSRPASIGEGESCSIPRASAWCLLLISFLGLLLLAFFLSRHSIKVFHRRSLMLLTPAYYLCIAVAVSSLRRPALARLAVTVALAASVACAGPYYTRVHKHNFRAASAYVNNHAQAYGEVLFEPVFFKAAFDHYTDLPYQHLQAGQVPVGEDVWCLCGRQKTTEKVLQFLQQSGFQIEAQQDFRLLTAYHLRRR